ncbi:MAG: hypothetical protein JSS04_21585 [Proteobacteria bacterium]|nr:hypothetical protein [Pseudomonadota bacterium]
MSDQAMPPERPRPDRPASGRFHPYVYRLLACLAAWFVISAWCFAGGGRTDLALTAVTGLFALMVGLPSLLALARRFHPPDPSGAREETTDRFEQWAERDVDLSTGPVKGKFAAIETALPIAAVAFGMTAFALVLHFSV